MAERKILTEIMCGDMAFVYILDEETQNAGLLAVPAKMLDQIDHGKKYTVVSLAQVKILGEEGYRALFSDGRTMTNSLSSCNFKYWEQKISENQVGKTIITRLKDNKNRILEHHLEWQRGDSAVTMHSVFVNASGRDVSLEMLSSFSLGSITPFEKGDTPGALLLHRLRSRWADEGRLESVSIEDLQLEPSITGVSANTVRFGQVGTMPVREYFPFIAVEDIRRQVCWGAQLAWPGSWQMEAYRKDDALYISGGLADRNSGHWIKKIGQGERFTTPQAIVTTAEGSVDALAQRLTSLHYRAWERQPKPEASLPALFNEWCMTWGGLNADTVERAVKRLKGAGIKYFVMDAGWYDHAGDWNPAEGRFPEGLEKTVQLIKDSGMIPGIWFEYECCETESKAFSRTEHQLGLDGYTITESGRHFWDMRDPYSHEYLKEKVIDFLKKYGFGYFKIDYNAAVGIGCDGAESPGEGLRQHLEGMIYFVKKIRLEMPELVIENCSSGGHRLEPCMMGLTAVSSFSDAHETINIPIVAANLHRAMLPCQALVWAVVRKNDTPRRLYYTMVAGLLGRLSLSGNIDELDESQWNIVGKGIDFYNKITPALKKGFTYWYGAKVNSYRHPRGWQAILRMAQDTNDAYAVIHTFARANADWISFDLPRSCVFELIEGYAEDAAAVTLDCGRLIIATNGEFQGFAVRMKYRPA